MRITHYARQAYSELSKQEANKLRFYQFVQISNSLLDILGVGLIGLMISEAQSSQTVTNNSALTKFLPSKIFDVSQNESILILLIGAAICFIVKAISAPLMQRRILLSLGTFSSNLSVKLEKKLFSRDLLFVQRRTTQETAFLLTEGTFLAFQGMLGFVALVISELFLVLFLTVLLLVLNLTLTLFIILYFATILYLLNKFTRSATRENSRTLNSSLINSRISIQETLNSYREIYVGQSSQVFAEELMQNLTHSVKSRANLNWLFLIPKYILDACIIFGIILIGGFATLFISQESAVSLCILFTVSASRIMPSLLRMNTGVQGINSCADATDYLHEFISDLENSIATSENCSSDVFMDNQEFVEIRVENLSFKYTESKSPIIDNLSFKVPFGEFLAVVGPSGSGKSTLVDLLMGVIQDPNSSIKIAGLDPRSFVKLNAGFIGYVPQKVALMNRTLRENIAIGVPMSEIMEEWVDSALKKSALAEFIRTLPNDLDTVVGENGYNFSGGQLQRLGLARALYTNPKILILDEATSALDAETENIISESLTSFAGHMTLIVVAHRLATVRKANRILYLGENNSFEFGTFEELRAKVPRFETQAKLLGL
jgi:ABC-type multidrug transport system fused ATPase/permease subunit